MFYFIPVEAFGKGIEVLPTSESLNSLEILDDDTTEDNTNAKYNFNSKFEFYLQHVTSKNSLMRIHTNLFVLKGLYCKLKLFIVSR